MPAGSGGHENKWMRFQEVAVPGRKTRVVACVNRRAGHHEQTGAGLVEVAGYVKSNHGPEPFVILQDAPAQIGRGGGLWYVRTPAGVLEGPRDKRDDAVALAVVLDRMGSGT